MDAFSEEPLIQVEEEERSTVKWSSRFVDALKLEGLEKSRAVASLALDFNHHCFTFGSIILQEFNLPVAEKTIKPSDLGGRAGGVKYIHGGVLFKIALAQGSVARMYNNNDEYASKAAGHEFRSNSMVFKAQEAVTYPADVKRVHTALSCLLEYRGLRCLATALLPLKELQYGSQDAGVSVRAGLPEMNRSMEAIGRSLGLASHIVGNSPGAEKRLALAVDCEGHTGHDDNFYIVDTARVMPPEDFRQTGSLGFSVYWRLFRPELLSHLMQQHGAAYRGLSSDALTGFCKRFDGTITEESRQLNQNSADATRYLLREVGPPFPLPSHGTPSFILHSLSSFWLSIVGARCGERAVHRCDARPAAAVAEATRSWRERAAHGACALKRWLSGQCFKVVVGGAGGPHHEEPVARAVSAHNEGGRREERVAVRGCHSRFS